MNDAGKQVLTFPHFQPHFDRPKWALPTVLEHQAQTIGDRPFLSWQDDGAPLSFAAVNVRVNRLAHGLAAHGVAKGRSEEHTSELQSLMRISYAVFCLKQ